MRTADPKRRKLIGWLVNGETGLSSLTMVRCFEGLENRSKWDDRHPLDPDDFWRCCRLLIAVPEYRERLDELRELSDVWGRLVDNWPEFERLLFRDLPSRKCGELYERMKAIGC